MGELLRWFCPSNVKEQHFKICLFIHFIISLTIMGYAWSRLIHFHTPHAQWFCYTTKHQRMAKLGLGNSLVFWVVRKIDSANFDVTCGLSPKPINALNSFGQLLLNNDIPVAIVLLSVFYTNKLGVICFATIDWWNSRWINVWLEQ